MTSESPVLKEGPPSRFFLPSLALASFSVGISNALVALLAVDIAKTFFGSASPTAVASVSQLSTFNSAAEVISAILLSILAIRFRNKPLLLVGSLLVATSAVGSFLAPTLLTLQLFYAFEGLGTIMVNVMVATSIGNFLPANKKPKAISYMTSVGSAAFFVVVILIGFLTNVGGWRSGFLLLTMPFSLAGLVLVSIFLPSKPPEQTAKNKGNQLLNSFKQIFTNRSATACLVANILTVAGTQVAIFAVAFYRTQFGVPRNWTLGIYEISLAIFFIAPFMAGPLVNKYGAKRIAVLSTLLAAFFTMMFFFIPNVYLAVAFDMTHVWFTVIAFVSFACLVLDQVPRYRGTLMSLNSLFNSVGNAIAPAVGGALLVLTNGVYGSIGLALGAMAISGSILILFIAKDVNKVESNNWLEKQQTNPSK